MPTITPDFSVLSRYNNEVNVDLVRYGANSNVLESELNEMQQVTNFKLQQLIAFAYNNGLSSLSTMSFANSTFTIGGCFAVVSGILLYISTSTVAAAVGTTIYLDTWTSSESYTSTLRKYGNTQGTTVTNYFEDPIVNQETSRRQIRNYQLSTTNVDSTHSYLCIARVVSGGIVSPQTGLITLKQGSLQGKYEDVFTSTAGQTVFNLTSGTYQTGCRQLDVYINGIRQPRSLFTETSSTRFTLVATNILAGLEVVAVYG